MLTYVKSATHSASGCGGLVRPPQLPDLGRNRRSYADVSLVTPGRAACVDLALRSHLLSVSSVPIPNFAATDAVAAHSESYWSRTSPTRPTARSRRGGSTATFHGLWPPDANVQAP